MAVDIQPVAPGDIEALAADMRQADVDEMLASSGPDIMATLHRSVLYSPWCWSARADGELLAVFGFAPISALGDMAAPWLLGTPAVLRFPRMLSRTARRYCADVRQVYPHLVNFVDARNEASIAWLRMVGFEIDPVPVPFGWAGLPFHRFEMKG